MQNGFALARLVPGFAQGWRYKHFGSGLMLEAGTKVLFCHVLFIKLLKNN